MKRIRNLERKAKGEDTFPILSELRRSVYQYHKDQANSAKVRSRVKEDLFGEKCNKYFFTLEKRRQGEKLMSSLKRSDGSITEDSIEIMEEVRSFYQCLFKKGHTNEADQNTMLSCMRQSLPEHQKQICDTPLDLEDLTNALRSMENGKTPGSDGLTVEFYRHFWDYLKNDLLKSHLQSVTDHCLSNSQKQALITSLHKSGARDDIGNWRPISLLNTDYKIISKAIANKISQSLPFVISDVQTASVPGRSIFSNLSTVRDIINYAYEKNIAAAIISVDHVKAFDCVDWNFLIKILEKLGYGPRLIDTVKTLYSGITSSVKVNGYISLPFILERGVRQGCPLSMLLYVIYGESLASFIKGDKSIKGISVNDQELKLSQFADDTDFFVTGMSSIYRLQERLDVYKGATGFRFNMSKCQGLWLGSWRHRSDAPLGFSWSHESIDILGIRFFNPPLNTNYNWDNCLQKIMTSKKLWECRTLSLKGKRLVLNQILLSRLWYIVQVLPVPMYVINNVTKLTYEFLWGDSHPCVNRLITTMPKEDGGLGILDFQMMILSFRLRCIGKLFDQTCGFWKILMTYNLDKYRQAQQGKSVFLTHINSSNKMPSFYKELFNAWIRCFQNRHTLPTSLEDILNQPLFYNNNITTREHPSSPVAMYLKPFPWAIGRLITIGDISKVFSSGFLSNQAISEICHVSVPVEEYGKLINAIPSQWRRRICTESVSQNYLAIPPCVTKSSNKDVKLTTLSVREFYKILMLKKVINLKPRYLLWNDIFKLDISKAQWKRIFLCLFRRNSNKGAFDIKWKILHRGLPTQKSVFLWQGVGSPFCIRCAQNIEEDLEHLFFSCSRNELALKYLFELLEIFLPDTKKVTTRWPLLVLGFEHFGFKSTEVADRIVDLYFQVVYGDKIKFLKKFTDIVDPCYSLRDKFLSELSYYKSKRHVDLTEL